MTDTQETVVEKAERTLFEVLHILIDHVGLSPVQKLSLKRSVDVLDPDVDNSELEPDPAPAETPEEELARLRALAAKVAADKAAQGA